MKTLLKNTFGGIAIMFAMMLPMVLGAVGVSIDFAQAYLVQQRLAQALDAAALAGAASSIDAAEIEAKVLDFFAVNYPPEVLGVEFTPHVVVDGNQVRINGTARYDTLFVSAVGIEYINVEAHTTVDREIRGLEVVMVLDNTGSMAEEMQSLKDAADNFVDIIFDSALEDDDVRIGIVPYSSTVNLGSYGRGKNPDGSNYDGGTAIVTEPAGLGYSSDPDSTTSWNGCVVEHKSSNYSPLATHITNSKGQLWRVGSSSTWNGHGYNPASGSNDPSPNDYTDAYTGPWDPYIYGRVIAQNSKCSDQGSGYSTSRCSSCNPSSASSTTRDKCNTTYCFCWYSNVNQYCPAATVMPMTSDREALHDHIDTMEAEGATVPTSGMNWGFRVLSPEAPFREGSGWNHEYWQKAVLFMTDGETAISGDATSYWMGAKNNISNSTINTRLQNTCTTLKNSSHNVKIYTVIFGSLDATTRAVYSNCASPNSFYEALTQEELVEVFEDIARELANLHISE
ncbi:MAG TPA: vWA domain-containing protein [Alphaproteobacteria bacterium]